MAEKGQEPKLVRKQDLAHLSRTLFKDEDASAETAAIAETLRKQIANHERQILAFSAWIEENTHPHENLFEIDRNFRAQASESLQQIEAALQAANNEFSDAEREVYSVLMEGVPLPRKLSGLEATAAERLVSELKKTLTFEPCKMTFVEHRKQADLLQETKAKKKKQAKKTILIQHNDPEVRRLCAVRQVSLRVLYGLARQFDLLQQENALQDHHFKEIDQKIHDAVAKALFLLRREETLLREIACDRRKWAARFTRLKEQFAAIDLEAPEKEKAKEMVGYTVGDYIQFEDDAADERKKVAAMQHGHTRELIEATLARVGLKQLAEWRSKELTAAGVEEACSGSSSSSLPQESAR